MISFTHKCRQRKAGKNDSLKLYANQDIISNGLPSRRLFLQQACWERLAGAAGWLDTVSRDRLKEAAVPLREDGDVFH